MRPTSILGAVGLVIIGLIVADFLIHPSGTTALGNVIVAETKVAGNQLIGTPAK